MTDINSIETLQAHLLAHLESLKTRSQQLPQPQKYYPEQFDSDLCMFLFKFASAAYDDYNNYRRIIEKSWTCSSFEDFNTGAYAIVCHNDDYVVLAFKGTSTAQDSIQDLLAFNPQGVHTGFHQLYASISRQISEHILDLQRGRRRTLMATGHSLGAAMAQMYVLDETTPPVEVCYVFSSPRVFSPELAVKYDREHKSNWRIDSNEDPVPTLPPESLGYLHPYRVVNLDKNGNQTGVNPNAIRTDINSHLRTELYERLTKMHETVFLNRNGLGDIERPRWNEMLDISVGSDFQVKNTNSTWQEHQGIVSKVIFSAVINDAMGYAATNVPYFKEALIGYSMYKDPKGTLLRMGAQYMPDELAAGVEVYSAVQNPQAFIESKISENVPQEFRQAYQVYNNPIQRPFLFL